MNINKNNYEAFFLDYHEGNLSPHEVAELLLFIEEHPELKEEFESFENITLEELPIEFENKEELKKMVVAVSVPPRKSFDEILVASVEGLLTREEQVLLDRQLASDAALNHEFLLYQKTKLIAENEIVFENKEKLKHSDKKPIPLYYVVSVAASLLVLIGLFFVFNNSGKEQMVSEKIKSQKPKIENKVNGQLIADSNKEEKVLVVKSKVKKNRVLQNTQAKEPVLLVASVNESSHQKNNNEQQIISIEPIRTDAQQEVYAAANNEQRTKNNEQLEVIPPDDFLSLRELAAVKIKEKIGQEEIHGKGSKRSKRISAWDLAQLAAKGFNKLTGRNVEVKPTYDEQGAVVAYSLSAGEFQISRGR